MFKTTIDSVKFAKGIKDLRSSQTNVEKAKAAQYILELSNKHGGLFTKIVQLLGTSANQIDSLKKWQNSFDSGLDIEQIIKIVNKELNVDFDEAFSEITSEVYCASIGQVNKAYLKNGSKVALKVQYPRIEKSIKDQLKLLKILPVSENFGPMKKWGMEIGEYYQMIYDTLSKELNYLQEIDNQNKFAKSMQDLNCVKVAKIYSEFVSSKCYVQEFIEGDQLDKVIETWGILEKEELSKVMLKTFLYSVFKGSIIHEDSNHYNYLFQRDDQIKVCVLDFGQCIKVDKNYQKALIKLFDMTINETDEDPFGYLVDLGFNQDKLSHIHGSLPVVMRILLAPFCAKYNYDLKSWNYKENIEKVLGDSRWWFRSAGGVKFFEIMKSFVGIKNMLERLEVKINWNDVYVDTLSLIDNDWNSYQTSTFLDKKFTFYTVAKNLKVQVIEDSKVKVDASFPASTLIEIEDFLNANVLVQLENNGVNTKEVIRKKMASGLMPGEVFFQKVDNKEYRVWLE